ncbi:MAG: glycosyltransferase family 2 protein [Candidatus Omnitrophota bacterium]
MPRISVIIPAHNEEHAIEPLLKEIWAAAGADCEIIVVNDGSTDATAELAARNGARVISHAYRIGNGAAVKTGIRNAKGEVLVMLDADGQHKPSSIPEMAGLLDKYHMVVGARKKWENAPLHRTVANIIYNSFASYLIERPVEDLTSGFRAIKAVIARKFVYLLPNTFSYPSTLTMALSRAGYSIGYVPIDLRLRKGKSKIHLISDGTRFLVIMMKIATLFSPLRIFIPVSLICFATGVGYAAYKILVLHVRYTILSVLLIMTAVMVFLMGLIAEQITQLRLERSESE